jgi:dGTPase
MEATRDRYRRVVEGLFGAYRAEPARMPAAHRQRAEEGGLERAICDYVAGMTDRFALDEYQRLFGIDPLAGEPAGRP